MRRRDDGSFAEFVAARGNALLRTAALLCARREDAEDVLQTALERAYRNWHRILADSNPEPYVRRIIVNTAISRDRRRRRLRITPTETLPEFAQIPVTEVEMREELMRGLRALGPRQRAVIVLRYWEDLSEVQTAELLGCSPGTVKSQAARGLARLRELLGSRQEEQEVGHGP